MSIKKLTFHVNKLGEFWANYMYLSNLVGWDVCSLKIKLQILDHNEIKIMKAKLKKWSCLIIDLLSLTLLDWDVGLDIIHIPYHVLLWIIIFLVNYIALEYQL
jgi:hypothetical protein